MAKTAKTTEAVASPAPKVEKTEKAPKAEKKEKAPKAEKKEEVAAPVVATPAPVEAKAAAPKKERAPKKEKEVAAPAPVVETEVAAAAAAPSAETAAPLEQINAEVIIAKVKTFMALGAEILKDVRTLEKTHARKLKDAQKAGQKKKRKSVNPNQAGGFTKQIAISESFADFLGKEHGSTLSHIDATKEINAYIRANSLQNKDKALGGGRVILADAKLCKLFGLSAEAAAGGALTYFNLQRYIAPHFKKTAPVATA
jgi:chromatin remodeling complex protein RSC6